MSASSGPSFPTLPKNIYEYKSAPLAALKYWASQPKLGDARIAALENLAERSDLSWADFAEIFLSPQTWADPDEHVRWLAVNALGRRTPERGCESLVEALLDSSWLVREHAVFASLKAVSRLGAQAHAPGFSAARLNTEILPLLLYFLRAASSEISHAVEQVLSGLLQREPDLFITFFEQAYSRASPRERASFLRAASRGLAFAALQQVPFVVPFFDRLVQQFESSVHSPSVDVRVAAAQSLHFLADFYLQNNVQTPSLVFALIQNLLCDPHPQVRASASLALATAPALQYFAQALLRISEQHIDARLAYEQMIELSLRAAARAAWNTGELPTELRDLWYKVVLRYLGHNSFRVRRSARAVVEALGPSLIVPLVDLCLSELHLLTYDKRLNAELKNNLDLLRARTAGERRALDVLTASFLLEKTLMSVAELGGAECLLSIEQALHEPTLLVAGPLASARAKILARLFALRSLCIVLWNTPERESKAGLPIQKALERLKEHPCVFIGRAANLGQ